MSKFIMLVGLPGSGKTYITENYFSRAKHISSDAIREELWGDANDQRNGDKVFYEMDKRTCSALEAGEDVVYDATNMNSRKRKAVVRTKKVNNIYRHSIILRYLFGKRTFNNMM